MTKSVIFDFDGVIINSEPLHYKATAVACELFDLKFDYLTYMSLFAGYSDVEKFSRIFISQNREFTSENIKKLVIEKENVYMDIIYHQKALPFVPGVQEYIQKLIDEKTKIAICSGATHLEVMSVLKKMGSADFWKHFEVIVTIEDVKNGKPDPEGYLLVSSKLGINPQDGIVIEDSPRGIQAAKKAGIKVIGLSTTYKTEQLGDADIIIPGFSHLLKQKSESDLFC